MWNFQPAIISCFTCLLLAASFTRRSCAWILPSTSTATRWVSFIQSTSLLSTSSSSSVSTDQDIMGGVRAFEEWFATAPGAICLPSIRHASFGSLRGLGYNSSKESLPSKTPALKIPSSRVLSVPYDADADWDVQLAQKLWDECCKGSSSHLAGYCSLLTLGSVRSDLDVPPSTAPNALRHWSSHTRQLLEASEAGTKLLQAQQAQSLQWRNKYSSVRNSNMSWEQFEWCMEVVHSRAFCGITTGGALGTLVATSAPIVAGGIGMAHLQNNPVPDDAFLVGLAAFGALPVLASFVFQEQGTAALLPLVDSANHLEGADSAIEYNPISKAFELVIGPKCLGKEGEQTQLYISYGDKSDAEWLLNYGFLPNVTCSSGCDEAARDTQRTALAETFVQRNP